MISENAAEKYMQYYFRYNNCSTSNALIYYIVCIKVIPNALFATT